MAPEGVATGGCQLHSGTAANRVLCCFDLTAGRVEVTSEGENGIAESQLLPAISISDTFGGTASTANTHNLGQIFTSSGIAHAGGPAFQWNILNYGQITNNVRLQDAKLQQLLVDYQNAVLAAEQQVDDGISAFIQSRSQAEYLRRSADAADGSLNVVKTQYQSGMTDFTTVLVAEQNLFQLQSNLAVACANVSLGATAIYRALGGGWQTRENSEFVTAATRDQMRARTEWGSLLPPAGEPQPPAPGLPSPGGSNSLSSRSREPHVARCNGSAAGSWQHEDSARRVKKNSSQAPLRSRRLLMVITQEPTCSRHCSR
jgi:hypothetical protein